MKKVILFSLVAAICAGVMLYLYLGKLEQQKQVEIVYETVVVAAQDIPAYTSIAPEMLTTKQVAQGSSHPLAARTITDAVGFVTEGAILAGEEVIPAKLKQPGQVESGLSYVVPKGMRAMTIAVDEISGIAGFLQRGDYVDIYAYLTTSYLTPEQQAIAATTEQTSAEQATTVLAAQNVSIVAVGTSLAKDPAAGEGGGVGYSSVTVLVTPDQAMRLIQSARSGVVMMVIRANGDHETITQQPVVSDSLLDKAD